MSIESLDVSPRSGLIQGLVGPVMSRPNVHKLVPLVMLMLALPVAAYFWFISHYGVNVIYGDQWGDVNVVAKSYSGTLGWGTLWAQRNQQRMPFPNLLAVLLARMTHLNVSVEMYLSAAMLVVAAGLFILSHRRRSPTTPWLYYVPVAVMLLSFVQYENTLWGIQAAVYMVLLSLASVVFLLDRPTLTWVPLAAAMAAAVVGSYSYFQGLFIWPAGLVLLLLRRRRLAWVLAWCTAGAATVLVYFYHFSTQSAGISAASELTNPAIALKFFFLAIGDVVGRTIPNAGSTAITALGIVIFLAAVYSLAKYGLRRNDASGAPVGITMISYGLLFACFTAVGRSWEGLSAAGASRYTTFDLLILAGIYLTALTPGHEPARQQGRTARGATIVFTIGATLLVALQVVLGTYDGVLGGRSTLARRLIAVEVLENIDRAPPMEVQDFVYPLGFHFYSAASVAYVRGVAATSKRLHLGMFASGDVHGYQDQGLATGRWASLSYGAGRPPVVPWRGVRSGEKITLNLDIPTTHTNPLVVTECNNDVIGGDSRACDASASVVGRPRDGHMKFAIVTGVVGDGTCDTGQVCYIQVNLYQPDRIPSLAEIVIG